MSATAKYSRPANTTITMRNQVFADAQPAHEIHKEHPGSNGNGVDQTASHGERREVENVVNVVEIVAVGGNDTQNYDGHTVRAFLKMMKEASYGNQKQN